ncbi:hypothetical protein [Devosia sp. Leaf64]|uniref:hypothetical protein n=1 Tax=Devosia sp. Leaf64 TaxID=1736229 RepID=UPI000714FDDF|nr:hypothetical protein [Devosia sp. Leaf64]KQN78280.1 hypothetical protein ASE94_14955 [Devosia sp. Leaf64]
MAHGLASLFEANPLDGELDTFSADMATYNLGSFLIGKTSASPQTFQRDANLVSAVGVDHLLVQLYVNGSCEFDVEGYQTRGKAGDLVCFDLSRQMKSATTQLDTISLVVPRQLMAWRRRHSTRCTGPFWMGKPPLAFCCANICCRSPRWRRGSVAPMANWRLKWGRY